MIVIIIVITMTNYNNKNKIYKEITEYVTKNENNLKSLAEEKIKGNKISLPKEIKSIDIYRNNNYPIVEFEYIKKNNTIYGFYYSPDDIPAAYHNKNYDLLELGNNKWMWNKNDKEEGTTEKIKTNWYNYSIKK